LDIQGPDIDPESLQANENIKEAMCVYGKNKRLGCRGRRLGRRIEAEPAPGVEYRDGVLGRLRLGTPTTSKV
jgi:hypothetical protein